MRRGSAESVVSRWGQRPSALAAASGWMRTAPPCAPVTRSRSVRTTARGSGMTGHSREVTPTSR